MAGSIIWEIQLLIITVSSFYSSAHKFNGLENYYLAVSLNILHDISQNWLADKVVLRVES